MNFGTTGLFVTASATQPPTSANPPNGVTGPTYLPNRCGSSTSKYKLPENIVMPAVSKPMASVFCGAATDASVSTAEWTSWYCAAVPQLAACLVRIGVHGGEVSYGGAYRCGPGLRCAFSGRGRQRRRAGRWRHRRGSRLSRRAALWCGFGALGCGMEVRWGERTLAQGAMTLGGGSARASGSEREVLRETLHVYLV